MLVFVFWDAFETIIWYFFCVETLVGHLSSWYTFQLTALRGARWRSCKESSTRRIL